MGESVFQEWMFDLPMQQQSVLVLACRGPDGVAKRHPTKDLICRYRASVLKAAYLGRAMEIDEGDLTPFMSLKHFSNNKHWTDMLDRFFVYDDEIALHYYMHLAHGAEIIGYKHPVDLFRVRWRNFYHRACGWLHLPPESEADMDARLADWGQAHWDRASVQAGKM